VKTLAGKDRLIVALDVPNQRQAMDLVHRLDNVSFFKIGLRLFMTGDIIGFINRLRGVRPAGQVFVDLKIGGDIGNTITQFMRYCMETKIVKFLTLVETVPPTIVINTVKTAREARGSAGDPRLLMVPYLSSLDATDLKETTSMTDLDHFILERAEVMLKAGCDGLIVSGEEIGLCRRKFPKIDIVSPGIRPAGSSQDDHKRFTTPTHAIELGADYLVVGRPIIQAGDPRGAAERIIEEIDAALSKKSSSSGSSGPSGWSSPTAMAAKGRDGY
jgi:orotidine-5'-phosphate decarboxylase